MSLPAWLRFAELSLLAGWLAWRAYGRRGSKRSDSWVPVVVFALSAGQLVFEAQAATDPFTPLTQMLAPVLGSAYGALSAAVCALSAAAAVWLWRVPLSAATAWAPAFVLLVLSGAASAGAAEAVSAASSSGEIAMSPTLAVPRATLSTPNPYANDPASAQRGRLIYQQYCVTCHGINGDGNGPAVAGLRVRPPTFRNPQHFLATGMDGAHFWVVQHGDGQPGGMPAWQGTLTDQQIWDAVNYVKAIAAGQGGGAPTAS